MKQKNLILLVVAVGCGLLAAFLTTQMGAKTPQVEKQDVYVAAKEITIGTKIEKEKFADVIKKKPMAKADVPLNAITSEEELIGKTFTEGRHEGETILIGNVGNPKIISPPSGKHLYVIKLAYEMVAGPFVQPGSYIDVVCTVRPLGSAELKYIQLIPKLLVIAVDLNDKVSAEGKSQVVNTLTLATEEREEKWLQMAQDAGAQIRFLIRGEETKEFTMKSDEELERIFFKPNEQKSVTPVTQDLNAKKTDDTTEKPIAPPVKIPVATKEIKAGTVIDDDFINKLMMKKPYAAPAPSEALLDLAAHKGRIITSDVAINGYLTENVLSEKTTATETPKPMTAETPKVEVKVETPKVEEKKPINKHYVTLATGSGTKKYLFEQFETGGEYIYKGEVNEDGSVTAAPMPNLQPKEKPKSDSGN